jgi:hypothetical protein
MQIEKACIHYVKWYYYKPVNKNVLINCTVLIFLIFRRILSAEDTVWPTGSGATSGTTSGSRMDLRSKAFRIQIRVRIQIRFRIQIRVLD